MHWHNPARFATPTHVIRVQADAEIGQAVALNKYPLILMGTLACFDAITTIGGDHLMTIAVPAFRCLPMGIYSSFPTCPPSVRPYDVCNNCRGYIYQNL